MSDWKEKAIAAHRAKQEGGREQAVRDERNREVAADNALFNKLKALDIPIDGVGSTPGTTSYFGSGIKFKVVRDKSKPAEDASSWDLYMGKSEPEDINRFWWYGPLTNLEEVGCCLEFSPFKGNSKLCHSSEPEDYGSETPAYVAPTAADTLLNDVMQILNVAVPTGDNDLLALIRIGREIANQLSIIAARTGG